MSGFALNHHKASIFLPFPCTHWDKTCHIRFLIPWYVPTTMREHCGTIHHSAWFCPSPDGPQMSRNLSTFAARGPFQGTDVRVRWLTDCPKEASWLIQQRGSYSRHKLTWKHTCLAKDRHEFEYKYKISAIVPAKEFRIKWERARTLQGQTPVGK